VPTYDYQCRACGAVTEVIHSMLEDGPSVCEVCGGSLRRMVFPTGIIFKGSGFYRNDSRESSSTKSSTSEPSPPATSSTPAKADAPKDTSGGKESAS
jgi:putative FmdB family regulatory protein